MGKSGWSEFGTLAAAITCFTATHKFQLSVVYVVECKWNFAEKNERFEWRRTESSFPTVSTQC